MYSISNVMKCGCRCINCTSMNIESNQVSKIEADGYFDMHHTCKECNTHFDHLEGNIFKTCEQCGYDSS